MKKINKYNFCKTITKIHGIYRFDGFNKIKTSVIEQKKIIARENEIFKSWKNYLNTYYKEWIEDVYSRFQVPEVDLGESYNNFTYYNINNDNYDVLMRKDINGFKEVVLDLKTIPFLKDLNKTVLKSMRLTKDQNKISFIVDLENNEKYFGGIYDIINKTYHNEIYINVSSIEFTNDNNKVLYVQNNKLNRPYCIKLHNIGDSFNDDKVILEEIDDNVYIETSTTKDHKFVLINSLTKNDSKISIIDINDSNLNAKTLFERKIGVKYFIEHSKDSFFILSNFILNDNKDYYLSINKDYKLFCIHDKEINKQKLNLLIAPDFDEYFEDMDIFNDYLVIYLKKNLIPYILLHNIKTGENSRHKIGDPGEVHPCLNKNFFSTTSRFDYSNPCIFKKTMDFDFVSKTFKIVQDTKYNGKKFDPKDYCLEVIQAAGKDGENIPITLFHKNGLKKNRKNKVLLIGYGAYGLNLELNYDSVLLTAVDKNWVIAYAHIRGGNEKGRDWHESASLLNKHVSVEDYIACAYALVSLGYTHPNYLAGMGQSAGGGVVAQAVNYKPDLFRAIVLSHPFLDILSTLMDDSLPLTIPDYEEYGNPYLDPKTYNNIQSISPYENISNQEYPAMLITTSLDDPRVPYWGTLKYIEKLRLKCKEPTRIPSFIHKNICVKIFESGHFGPVNNDEALKSKAFELMWLDKMLIVKDNLLK